MKSPSSLPCGHSLCYDCILEIINQSNCCPSCKTPCKKEQIVKNYSLEQVIEYVNYERENELKNNINNKFNEYVEEIGVSNKKENNEDPENNNNESLASIKRIFFDELKAVFLQYENFFNKIKEEYDNKLSLVRNSMINNDKEDKEDSNKIELNEPNVNKKENKINSIEELEKIKERYNKIKNTIFNSLQDYLKNLPQTPLTLPILTSITVNIDFKKHVIQNVQLKRTDKISRLYDIVQEYFKNLNDPVSDFNGCYFLVDRNLVDENINKIEDSSLVFKDKEDLFLNYDIMSGEEIELIGSIEIESIKKLNCITYNFKPIICNYFNCNTCNKKWLCEACTKICHKGHEIVAFKIKHEATWACCYCFKGSNKCQLKNKLNEGLMIIYNK